MVIVPKPKLRFCEFSSSDFSVVRGCWKSDNSACGAIRHPSHSHSKCYCWSVASKSVMRSPLNVDD